MILYLSEFYLLFIYVIFLFILLICQIFIRKIFIKNLSGHIFENSLYIMIYKYDSFDFKLFSF